MRKKTNKIHALKSVEGQIQGPDLQNHRYQHFRKLFAVKNRFKLQMKNTARTTTSDLQDLQLEFQEEEIKKTVWELVADKAPGLDGFPMFFYRICWQEIKEDLKSVIDEAYRGEARLDMINYSMINLIPKKEQAETIGDFRPIALLNYLDKIITKILPNRLFPKLRSMIGNY